MKSPLLFAMLFLVASFYLPAQNKDCKMDVPINPNFSKAETLKAILKKYTTDALPGAALAVYSASEGWWAAAEGFSKVEDQTPMQICNLQYLQSVSKMYMAIEILQLWEQGKIKLDEPITHYLPVKYNKYVPNAAQITVRMLLNHTSGVPEYNLQPAFVSRILQYPLQPYPIEFPLEIISKEAPQFAPGSKFQYTNTNYLLLALIGDAITGDHAAFMANNIFKPLNLTSTYYRKVSKGANSYLVNSYWDVGQISKPANVTLMQQTNVASMIGDDGIICAPIDAVKFLKGLMEGKLLGAAAIAQMQKWVSDEAGDPVYGMGLYHVQLGDLEAYGHGGGGIGAGCVLLYIPSQKIYLFLATNAGVVIDNPLAKKADELKNEILMALLL